MHQMMQLLGQMMLAVKQVLQVVGLTMRLTDVNGLLEAKADTLFVDMNWHDEFLADLIL